MLLLAALPLIVGDLEIQWAGGRIATILQDSCAQRDSLLYSHCLCVDNPQFGALDSNSSGFVELAELAANLGASSSPGSSVVFSSMDTDASGTINVMEYGSRAQTYLAASALVLPSVAPATNITCPVCAPGWAGVRCTTATERTELKIAVQASASYFTNLKQEGLRTSLATTLQWHQSRVVILSVTTTTDQGQVVNFLLLHGHGTGPWNTPAEAAMYLASPNRGSMFFEVWTPLRWPCATGS
jgi:hypothetical protein